MSDRTDYSDLTREQLEERLRLAEDVCVLVGWIPVPTGSDRQDALTELWQDWDRYVGGWASNPAANPHLSDAVIHGLAEQRRAKRRATLDQLTTTALAR